MSWIRFDDGFADRPDLIEAGAIAFALASWAIAYSARHLTDGFIARGVLAGCPWVSKRSALDRACANLERAHFWTRTDNGFEIVDPFQYLQTAETVRKKRADAAKRQAAWRERQARRNGPHNAVTGTGRNALPYPDPKVGVEPAPGGASLAPCAECGTGLGFHAADCSRAA